MGTRILRRLDLLAPMLASVLSGPAAAQFDQFTWTYSSPTGSGSGVVTSDTMVIVGPNYPSCPGGSTNAFTTIAPYELVVVADFDYITADKETEYDYMVTIVDGTESLSFIGFACTDCQLVLQVPAGSTFGFGVHSVDCQLGEASVTLSNLLVQPAPQVLAAAGSEPASEFGSALVAMDDLEGDGVPEVAVGAPGALGDKGRVTLHKGSTLAVLRTFVGTAAGDRFGAALALAGDLDGDGAHELLVGAPGGDAGGLDSGAVSIVSSATGLLLGTLPGVAAGDHFGTAVAGPGDVMATASATSSSAHRITTGPARMPARRCCSRAPRA
jgi:hypothetical protein